MKRKVNWPLYVLIAIPVIYVAAVLLMIWIDSNERNRIVKAFDSVHFKQDINEIIGSLGKDFTVTKDTPQIYGGTTYVNCSERRNTYPVVSGDEYYTWRFEKQTHITIIISVVNNQAKDKWIEVISL